MESRKSHWKTRLEAASNVVERGKSQCGWPSRQFGFDPLLQSSRTHHCDQRRFESKPVICSRILNSCGFPETAMGISSTIRKCAGILKWASSPSQNSLRSSGERFEFLRGMIQAQANSPYLSYGAPKTCAAFTSGWRNRKSSISFGKNVLAAASTQFGDQIPIRPPFRMPTLYSPRATTVSVSSSSSRHVSRMSHFGTINAGRSAQASTVVLNALGNRFAPKFRLRLAPYTGNAGLDESVPTAACDCSRKIAFFGHLLFRLRSAVSSAAELSNQRSGNAAARGLDLLAATRITAITWHCLEIHLVDNC